MAVLAVCAYSAENIRCNEGLRGDHSIAELCRIEGIDQSIYEPIKGIH